MAQDTTIAVGPGGPEDYRKLQLNPNGHLEITVASSAIPIGGTSSGTQPCDQYKITNIPVALANTEMTHTLQDNCQRITMRARGNARIQFAFTATESSTNFITIPRGASWSDANLALSGEKIYFQTNKADTVEILEWITGAGAVPSIDTKYFVEQITLTPLMIADEEVTLTATPTDPTKVMVFIKNGIAQFYGSDYTVSGAQVQWTGLGMASIGLVAGDVIRVVYVI